MEKWNVWSRTSLFVIWMTFVVGVFACNSSRKLIRQAELSNDYVTMKELALQRLQQKPTDTYALSVLGKVALHENHADSAIAFYEKALAIKPKDRNLKEKLIEARIVWGDSLLRDNSFIQAQDLFLRSLELDSSHFLTQCRLAYTYKRLGKYDEAKAGYRRAFRLNPAADSLQKVLEFFNAAHIQSNLLLKRGDELLKKKNYERAMNVLQKAIDAKPDNKEAQYLYHMASGLYFHKRGSVGRLWEAIDHFAKASNLKPEAAEPHFYMAEAYIKKDDKDFQSAIGEYEQVIKLQPDSELAQKAKQKIKKLKAREKLLKDFWKKK